VRRHTHDELENALGLRKLDDDDLFICPPILITFLLYRAIRNNGVETRQVLQVLCNDPDYLPGFLSLCGNDDIDVVFEFSKTFSKSGQEVSGAEIMRAWVTRQTVYKMLKKLGAL
jgi:hypothetical protein